MPARRPNRALVSLAADGQRLDDARRKLLADWCRLVGRRLDGRGDADAASAEAGANGAAASSIHKSKADERPVHPRSPSDTPPSPVAALGLPPRMAQILTALLAGASEKQIAKALSLSPHTVHTYVKQLHKRLDVSSRGELLAKFVHVGS